MFITLAIHPIKNLSKIFNNANRLWFDRVIKVNL